METGRAIVALSGTAALRQGFPAPRAPTAPPPRTAPAATAAAAPRPGAGPAAGLPLLAHALAQGASRAPPRAAPGAVAAAYQATAARSMVLIGAYQPVDIRV